MNAIGLIETKGLIPAIEAADSMLKTAQVELIQRSFVGGGLVTITVTGDVGAVKATVDAGVTAVLQFGQAYLNSHHVMPRPHNDVALLFGEEKAVGTDSLPEAPLEEMVNPPLTDEDLKRMSVKHLRRLAADYENLGLSEHALAMANKATLLKRFSDSQG